MNDIYFYWKDQIHHYDMLSKIRACSKIMHTPVESYFDIPALVQALEAHCWFETAGDISYWFEWIKCKVREEFEDGIAYTHP